MNRDEQRHHQTRLENKKWYNKGYRDGLIGHRRCHRKVGRWVSWGNSYNLGHRHGSKKRRAAEFKESYNAVVNPEMWSDNTWVILVALILSAISCGLFYGVYLLLGALRNI